MEYSYKFRLYPTEEQQEQITRNFGCCRYVFNYFLAQRQKEYRATGKAPTRFQQDKQLTSLKQELPWLKEVDSTSLQSALQDLDTAYQNFFRRLKRGEKPGYPRFKSKHSHRQSYKSKCVGTNIEVLDTAWQSLFWMQAGESFADSWNIRRHGMGKRSWSLTASIHPVSFALSVVHSDLERKNSRFVNGLARPAAQSSIEIAMPQRTF